MKKSPCVLFLILGCVASALLSDPAAAQTVTDRDLTVQLADFFLGHIAELARPLLQLLLRLSA